VFRHRLTACVAAIASLLPAAALAARDPLERVVDDLRTGHYERARKAADAVPARAAVAARAAVLGARAEQRLGLLNEARRRLEEASVRAPDDLPLRAELIRVADALGDQGAIKTLVDRSYEDWQAGRVRRTSAPELVAMAVALRYDNNWDDANANLRAAVKADPRSTEANLEWGDIFLEKHAAANAEASFRDVLKLDPRHPDAHAGLARVLIEQSYDEAAAESEIAAALAVNPRHARALALRGEIALDAEELEQVAAVVAELRRTNPRDDAAAWLAASRALLLDDRAGYEREKKARLEVRPGDGDFFARTAEALVRQRRYEEARAVAADGVALDDKNPHALASLGLTLLRLGDEKEGVATLRRAWDRDPYDARTFNLLDLYEKVIPKRYITVETAHLTFRVEPPARAAIEAVVGPYLEEVYAHYVERYAFTPAGRVMFELYGDPAHYAIRTVGLPRLGVTAVCFGRVITSQAPTNGAFNWGMVLAHELAHVFALQLSRSRVPRWFTEGLSELETAHLRPEWRRHGELSLWAALNAGALAPLEKLSQSFVHARDAEAASTAYMHAAVAVEYLERRFGFPKIREALVAFGRGERVAAVLQSLSGGNLAALERAFRDDLIARSSGLRDQFLPAHAARFTARTPRAEATPRELAELGLAQLYDGDARAARATLARALLKKGGHEDPTASFLTAELAIQAGETSTAVDELRGLLAAGHDGYDLRLRLAVTSLRNDDEVSTEKHLRRAIELCPTEVEPRLLLMELLDHLGRDKDRAREAEALLLLEPQSATVARRTVLEAAAGGRPDTVVKLAPVATFIDPADANVQAALGRALMGMGRTREARQAFERALRFTPDNAALHRALADALDKLGETSQAAAHRRAAGRDAGRD
jgi:tetratricopeptide (TPR) repeat protein